MYREYDQQTLKRLQQTELGILKDFLRLCEKYHLTYFSFAGTAIGALRHKGFIPWDDDIDVCMPRRDYQKFLKIVKREYPDRYQVMNAEENENYPLTTTRLMLKGTEFREEAFKDLDCPLGIFLDIYPFDPVPDDEKAYRRQAFEAWFYSKLLILRCIPEPVVPGKGWKAKLIRRACRLVHGGMELLHISKRKLYKRCRKAMTRYRGKETKRISYLCDTNRFWNTIALSDLYPLRQEPFEEVYLNFPRNVEKMLSQMWPDFMTLPPEDQRKNHYPYRLSFGDQIENNQEMADRQ